MVSNRVNIRGYHISQELYNGSRTLVYRGYGQSDQLPVAIKLLKNPYPNFNELVQFRNQYTITKNLDSPLIIQTYSLEIYQNGYALVMEDFGGISLQEWAIKKEKKLSLMEFLEVGITLCNALEFLYRERIIHKDIKPSNILINPHTKEIKLIDFSIASLLPKETQTLINPNILEGTLAYISPEQTGRMNRGIDYRTDFYSLGVTFYELLTGSLPFPCKYPMELLHCHIAKKPPLVNEINSEIPSVLSEIVEKLMAKNAEDRYQSALGLKYDLENCLTQLQQTGQIKNFEIGRRDVSDRFIIPDKLYGRETEIDTLLQAFERVSNSPLSHLGKGAEESPPTPFGKGAEESPPTPFGKGAEESPPTPLGKEVEESPPTPLGKEVEESPPTPLGKGAEESPPTPLGKGGGSEMMLVAGFSGIGKTAVVNEVHKPIVKQRGYFIKGKFDQFQRNIPFSAFVQAFRYLIGQLLTETEAQIQQWKNKILEAVGENGQVIIEVIPELEKIIGEQPAVLELSGTAAQNRFNLLFQKFTKVFTSAEHPLAIFLDDLQWADQASLKLIELLMADTKYLFLIGAYRDNEVNPAHPLILTLNEIEKAQSTINTITLAALNQIEINKLVADTLKCTEKLALPLSQLVFQKTQGNPFFATQFLKALHQEELIKFNFDLGCWECEMTQVTQQAVTDDVVEFMALQLEKLPQSTQHILQLAACIGNQFDLTTLAIISEHSEIETATYLWRALQEGLILPTGNIYKFYIGQENQTFTQTNSQRVRYKFLHDRVQQAAYFLIPEEKKKTTHYQIGQQLLQNTSKNEQAERIFEIVNQLNYGKTIITEQKERDELAELNLIACRKARSATAYQAGREYAKMGLLMLGENPWRRQYKMTLALHELAAELASLCGDFEEMEQFIETVIAKTSTLLEQVNVYRIKIQVNSSENKLTEAIAIAQNLLQQLGIIFPETPTEEDIQIAIAEIDPLIGDREIEDLVYLPQMKDLEKIAIVEIANSIMAAASISGSPLFPLLVALSVKLSIQYGNTSTSAMAYACYGIVANNMTQDINTGVKFGQLAVSVLSQLDLKAAKPEVSIVVGQFILHRKSHIKEVLPVLQEGYRTALEVGDNEMAGHNAYAFCWNSFWCGQFLQSLEDKVSTYYSSLQQLNQSATANYCRIDWQSILNLLGFGEHPSILSGEALSEAEFLPQLLEASDFLGLYVFYLHKLMLCYLFGEIESAQNHGLEIRRYLMAAAGTVGEPAFYFYDSLTALAALNLQHSREEVLEQVEKNQTQLQQQWANYAPMNHQHKVDLVAAEICRIKGEKLEAIELYDKAISGAKQNEYIQEEALANELAAKFYLNWSKEKIAQAYIQEAYYCYARWGAKAKTNDLEKLYPQLLQPILQQQRLQFNPTETVGLNQMLLSTYTNGTSSTNISDALDFTSVLKAAQAISSSLELDQLIASLTRIILENSGAKKAVLMLPQDNTWQVKAITLICQQEIQTNLASQLLHNSPDIPIKIIHYVKNTKQKVLINNCQTNIPGLIAEYMLQHQPQSVLCTPMIHQENLVGILYLENNLTPGVFTPERLQIINLLSTQAAISLENAQLYAQQQEKNRQIAQKEEEYRSIFESVNDGLEIRDLETGRLVAANPTIYQIYGYDQEEWLQTTPADFIHPDYIHIFSNYLTTLRAGQEFYIQTIGKRNDGSFFDVEVRAVPFIYKGKLHGLAIVRDITEQQAALRERQKAEATLAKEREFLNAIVENITDGIVVCDASGKLVLFNQATRDFHGLPVESLPPEKWAEHFDLYQPDGNTLLSTAEIPLFRAWQGEIVENAEMVIVPKQGAKRILLASGQAIFDPWGNKVGAVVVMRDITERKQAELALQQKSQELETALEELKQAQLQIIQSEKMSALGNLVAGVGHEMNNPLGFISASLEQVKPTIADLIQHLQLYQESLTNKSDEIVEHAEEIDLDYSLEDLPKIIDSMIIACDRLKNISTSLRTFSRADKDYKVPFNIHEGIDSTVLILKHRLKANQYHPAIEVIKNYGNLPKIYCFPGQLNQVFMNIIANAIDALDESNIGLSFAEIEVNPNRIKITTSVENQGVKITICDNGHGMNEEVKAKIFDHLFTTKAVGKGTGLGLAIARQIIEQKHGGNLNVASTPGEGTEFTIVLPLQ
ncbi:AAA family ATPase [Okeania sp. SIO1I7]|uniref:protein kinase domain-containing protein n=1 Tax=Okeania sp. SIO1I7 TaxID=2607772 RepID=UPI0013FC1521|nr:AAA family ATPase [Okeania sp. SIO1I7]NET24847.1 AAA family ATPase [Okeania sp. SIO1I7]